MRHATNDSPTGAAPARLCRRSAATNATWQPYRAIPGKAAAATLQCDWAWSMCRRSLLALRLRSALPRVAAFLDLIDDLGAEGVQITWIAAGNDTAVRDHFAINPPAAGVDHVGFDRLVGPPLPPAHCVDFDQQPRRVAHRGNDFAGVKEIANQLQRLGIDAQQIGI